MSTVFISYAREDAMFVEALASALSQSGEKVWWDRKVIAGKKWRKELRTQIEHSKCVIVIWTKNSVNSEWVDCEAYEAAEHNKIIPIWADSARIPFDFRALQTLNFNNWNKSPNDDCFKELLECIAEYSKSSSLLGERQYSIIHTKEEELERTYYYLGCVTFFMTKTYANIQLTPSDKGLRILYIPIIDNEQSIEDDGYLNILVPIEAVGGLWRTCKTFLYAVDCLDENIILQSENQPDILIKLSRDKPEAPDEKLTGYESCWLVLINGGNEKFKRKIKLGPSDLISIELACQIVAAAASKQDAVEPRALSIRLENKRIQSIELRPVHDP